MLIKTFWIQNQNRHSSAGVGWRNWVFSSCSPWGANFSLLWHYSEVGWLERSSHQQPTICTTFQEWPKSLSKIIFHANFVEKFVCQKVELLCVSNSLMSAIFCIRLAVWNPIRLPILLFAGTELHRIKKTNTKSRKRCNGEFLIFQKRLIPPAEKNEGVLLCNYYSQPFCLRCRYQGAAWVALIRDNLIFARGWGHPIYQGAKQSLLYQHLFPRNLQPW